MENFLFPLLLILVASFFQGTFGLGMKYIKPLAWEAWWIVYALIAMILLPWIWAYLVVPDLWKSITTAPSSAIYGGMLFGFLWGVGGIMFGVSVGYVGVALTYGIVMGLAASVGSIIPLLQIPDISSNSAFPFVIIGVAIMLVGVYLSAVAGVRRDKLHEEKGEAIEGIKQGKQFRFGLVIAILSGVLSALLNVGFANALPIAKNAETLGANTRNSSLAAWVVVLFGAFIMNAAYAVFLLFKNKSWSAFRNAGSGKAYRWAILTGIFWFGALGVYGQGAALMGSLGPVVGWPILLGLALIISFLWALRAKEWKDAYGPMKTMMFSITLLIIACIILGYANSLI